MLKLPAFQLWHSPEKADYISYLNYITAFVANDRNWSARINDFALQFESPELQLRARLALVSNQALRAIVRSATEMFNQDLSEIPLMQPMTSIDKLAAQIKFSQQFSPFIAGSKRFVSTADIDRELGSRVDRLIQDTNAMRFAGGGEREVAKNHGWIFSDFLAPLHNAVVCFREVVCTADIPWCLCFDELELAHDDTRNLLFTYLRGSDPIFYFKLATVPFIRDISAFQSKTAPTPQHDFSVVELWNVKKDQSDQFMYQLANSALKQQLANSPLKQKGLNDASIETVLGNSLEYRIESNQTNRSYSRKSAFFSYFLALADTDPTFRRYLEEREIGVHDFFQMSEERRAAIFRKVQNIVVLRSAFRPTPREANVRPGRTVSRRRSSRGFIYSGAQTIVQLCDNNPRFLLAILSPLIKEFEKTQTRVKPEIQLEAVSQVSQQLWSVLKGEAIFPPHAGIKSVGELIRRLGRFFEAEIHTEPFNGDPVLSFTLPPTAPSSLIEAVGYGIREGALLLGGEYTGSYLRDGLGEKRVRLAYLFAPDFLLPLMLGRARHVEAMLRPRTVSKRPVQSSLQPDLFGGKRHE